MGSSRYDLVAVEHVVDTHPYERLEVVAVVGTSPSGRNRIVQTSRETVMRVGDRRVVEVSADQQVGRLLIVDVLIDLLDLLSTCLLYTSDAADDLLTV